MDLDGMIRMLKFELENFGRITLDVNDLNAVLAFMLDYKELLKETVHNRKQEIEANAEAVNNPAHYQGKRECIEVMRALFGDAAVMGFCKCNSFKYRFRQDGKGGAQDVEKAEWYEDYLIQMQNEHEERSDKIWNHTWNA